MDEFKKLFQKLTEFKPYKFQEEVFKKINNGKSVILQAPTGSGKTLASILPFLYNWIEWKRGNTKLAMNNLKSQCHSRLDRESSFFNRIKT